MWNVTRRRRTESDSGGDFSTNIISDGNEYIATIYLGNPLVKVTVMVDTGSGVNWIKGPPIYDAKKSRTYEPRFCDGGCPFRSGCEHFSDLCRYRIEYADGAFSTGIISYDNFAFEDLDGIVKNIGNLQFGYATESKDFSGQENGNLGLNRESISFVSQLGIQKFSHCLVSMDNIKGSRMHFGPSANVNGVKLPYDPTLDFHYFVTLEGIKVGNKYVEISPGVFAFNKNIQDSGVIFDIGTTFSTLYQKCYDPFAREMRNQMMKVQFVKPINFFDMCFRGTKRDFDELPTVMFEFDKMRLTFSKANTYVEVARNVLCLGILPEKNYQISIIGNFQMRDMLIGYDLANHQIAFANANCNNYT
ncbi:Beta-site APP-cleaving enzyme [Stylosanthes scabra]|uniref:Beta-site APP-cleaving enzyme n=1 Tax=Stylosanthes scabra TaxID=79078 RepID=A0ABU6SB98_9FABA|nr:Beta-site APP-cleaving enzyme [Stylosanthes scabra]